MRNISTINLILTGAIFVIISSTAYAQQPEAINPSRTTLIDAVTATTATCPSFEHFDNVCEPGCEGTDIDCHWTIAELNLPIPDMSDFENVVYIDPENGSKDNSGSSPDDALSSWLDVTTDETSFQPNTAYVQKRGTVDDVGDGGFYANAENVLFGAYGDPDKERPEIYRSISGGGEVVEFSGNYSTMRDIVVRAIGACNGISVLNSDFNTLYNVDLLSKDKMHTIQQGITFASPRGGRILNCTVDTTGNDGVYIQKQGSQPDGGYFEIGYTNVQRVNQKYYHDNVDFSACHYDRANSAKELKTGVDSGLGYRLESPIGAGFQEEFPLIVYLSDQGLGVEDTALYKLLTDANMKEKISGMDVYHLPYFFMLPVLPEDANWSDAATLTALKTTIENFSPADDTNVVDGMIYLVGEGAGAAGAYAFATQYPDLVSGVVAVSPTTGVFNGKGTDYSGDACSASSVPFWIFHPENDADITLSNALAFKDTISDCNPQVAPRFTQIKGGERNTETMKTLYQSTLTPSPEHDPLDYSIYQWLVNFPAANNGASIDPLALDFYKRRSVTSQSYAAGDGIQFQAMEHVHVHHTYIDKTSPNKHAFISNSWSTTHLFENNYVRTGNNAAGSHIAGGHLVGRNNVFEYILSEGEEEPGASGSGLYGWFTPLEAYNNIFINVHTAISVRGNEYKHLAFNNASYDIWGFSWNLWSETVYKAMFMNNILHFRQVDPHVSLPHMKVKDYNVYHSKHIAHLDKEDGHTIFADPLWANETERTVEFCAGQNMASCFMIPDLRLTADSPAIGAGSVDAFSHLTNIDGHGFFDFAGNPIDVSGPIDAGPYQYQEE